MIARVHTETRENVGSSLLKYISPILFYNVKYYVHAVVVMFVKDGN